MKIKNKKQIQSKNNTNTTANSSYINDKSRIVLPTEIQHSIQTITKYTSCTYYVLRLLLQCIAMFPCKQSNNCDTITLCWHKNQKRFYVFN